MQHVAVLGAAGKMGSGIALLLLQEAALKQEEWLLTLVDINSKGFVGLRQYLRGHLHRFAERNINALRLKFRERSELVDNGEMIECFVEEALDRVRCAASLEECRGAQLVFEAVLEDIDVKAKIFSELERYLKGKAYYFTNTSSIPIHVLQKKSGLGGRLIGFHFYNPPAVQKLLEIIVPEEIDPQLKQLAIEIGERLKKIIVFSKDVAGFIGNGHFIREIVEACQRVKELEKTMPQIEALCAVNRVTQELLLRPMGIFQLIDYVGIDICHHVGKIMTEYLGETLMDPMIEKMINDGIRGGQHPDGSQKDGFFQYEKGVPVKVYDIDRRTYVAYAEGEQLRSVCSLSWKALSKDKNKKQKIDAYFENLWKEQTPGAQLAQSFLERSLEIAEGLVRDGVAQSVGDVNTVLQQGFFHLYGVDEPFVAERKR